MTPHAFSQKSNTASMLDATFDCDLAAVALVNSFTCRLFILLLLVPVGLGFLLESGIKFAEFVDSLETFVNFSVLTLTGRKAF